MPPAQGNYSTNPSSSAYQTYHNQAVNSNSASNVTSPLTRPDNLEYMDVSMGDTDLYNGSKYGQTSRTQPLQQQAPQQQPQQQQHQQQSTAPPSSRQPYLQGGDDFGSGQRYSPMNPTNMQGQYGAPPPNVQHTPASSNYTPLSSTYQTRQSPTRPTYQNTQSNQSSYYSQNDSPLASGPPSLSSSQHAYQATGHSSRTGSINSGPQLPPISVPTGSNDPSRHYPSSAVLSPYDQHPHSPNRAMQAPPQQPVEPPRLIRITNPSELQPKLNKQPAFRRANPEGGFISPLIALTTFLPATYRICNPNFKYESSKNPRRVLTKPSKGVKNDGYDNEDSDYILYVNDTLGSEEGGHKNRYLILDVLGQGTFGQVVKCQNLKTQEVVAVKVIKNRTAYFNQSMMEVSVLDLLNKKLDKNDEHHILRLQDTFIHRQHLCLVFELLSVNLYELIKQNQFRGLSTTLVRVFAQQLLHALALLNKANLIHCDLKPENILLKNLESPMIKVIDFGSACDERQTVYTYIQSRFYRSPEVLLGLPYSSAIDMWSLGCIVVELFLGLPLFPGSSEYNQVARIHEMLGAPPAWMIEMGKQSGEYFERTEDEYGRKTYRLKSMEKYMKEHGTKEQPSKKYFSATTLPDIIRQYALPRKNMKPIEIEREMNNRVAFIDFVRGLLNINPLERWSPQQAKLHPFITQAKFTGPFVPPTNLKSSSMAKSPAPGTQQQQAAYQKFQEQEMRQRQAAQAQVQAQQAQQQQAQQQQAAQQAQQYAMGGYHQGQPAPVYNNMYTPPQAAAAGGNAAYGSLGNTSYLPTHVNANPQMQQQQPQAQYNQHQQPSLYQQASTRSAMQRQRASTGVDGVPVQIQRAASLMDPTQPIRLQPSPAYYPPGADGSGGRRGKANQGKDYQKNKDLIRNLEGTLEDGGMFNHWGGSGNN